MPCRYDPTPDELFKAAQARAERDAAPAKKEAEKATRRVTAAQKEINALTDANNALSVRVDYLQDLIFRMDDAVAEDGMYDILGFEIAAVLQAQEEHRQSDLDRLVRTISAQKTIDYDKLTKVLQADTSQPLEPQLGFDPDSI